MRPSERNRKQRNRRAMLILAGYFPVRSWAVIPRTKEDLYNLQTPSGQLDLFFPERATWEVAELEAVKAGLLPPQ